MSDNEDKQPLNSRKPKQRRDAKPLEADQDLGDAVNESRKQAKGSPIEQLQALLDKAGLHLKFSKGYLFDVNVEQFEAKMLDGVSIEPHAWTSCRRVVTEVSHTVELGQGATAVLPLGVTVVLGKSGSGKTRLTFNRMLGERLRAHGTDMRYYRVFEPQGGVALDEDRFGVFAREFDFEAAFAQQLADDLLSDETRVLIVDSLRYLFYSSSSGATGKGGVNMGLFADLTALDVVASRLGKAIVVVVNPLTDDPDAFSFYEEAAIGAVSGVLVCETPRVARLTTRLGDRAFRALKLVSDPLSNQSIQDIATKAYDQYRVDILTGADDDLTIAIQAGTDSNLGGSLFDFQNE